MPTVYKSAGNACLQLDLSDEPAAPQLPAASSGAVPYRDIPEIGRLLPPVELSQYIVPGTGGHGRARADALLAVIGLFACRVAVFGYDATRRDKFLIMVGARPVLDALDLLLPKIALRMEGAGRAAARAYLAEVRAAVPDMPRSERRSVLTTPYFRDYLRGFGSGAAEAIRDLRSWVIAASDPELRRILAVQDGRAVEAYDREFPDPKPMRKEKAGHRGACLAGRDAGLVAGFDDEYAAQHDLVFALL